MSKPTSRLVSGIVGLINILLIEFSHGLLNVLFIVIGCGLALYLIHVSIIDEYGKKFRFVTPIIALLLIIAYGLKFVPVSFLTTFWEMFLLPLPLYSFVLTAIFVFVITNALRRKPNVPVRKTLAIIQEATGDWTIERTGRKTRAKFDLGLYVTNIHDEPVSIVRSQISKYSQWGNLYVIHPRLEGRSIDFQFTPKRKTLIGIRFNIFSQLPQKRTSIVSDVSLTDNFENEHILRNCIFEYQSPPKKAKITTVTPPNNEPTSEELRQLIARRRLRDRGREFLAHIDRTKDLHAVSKVRDPITGEQVNNDSEFIDYRLTHLSNAAKVYLRKYVQNSTLASSIRTVVLDELLKGRILYIVDGNKYKIDEWAQKLITENPKYLETTVSST